MALFNKYSKQILSELNQKYQIGIKEEHVSWSPILPTEDGKCKINMSLNGLAPYAGRIELVYGRLPITDIFTDREGTRPLIAYVDLNTVLKTIDCLPSFYQFYGLEIEETDIEDLNLDLESKTGILKFKEKSRTFTGEIEFQLKRGDILLPTIFDVEKETVVELVPWNYPSENINVGQATIYSYPYDFSSVAKILKNKNATEDELALALSKMTGDPWGIFFNPGKFNLRGSVTTYNGINNILGTNLDFEFIRIIELSYRCTNFQGKLYLHYNDSSTF